MWIFIYYMHMCAFAKPLLFIMWKISMENGNAYPVKGQPSDTEKMKKKKKKALPLTSSSFVECHMDIIIRARLSPFSFYICYFFFASTFAIHKTAR